MKKHLFRSMLAVVVCLAGAQPLVGQDGGGGFIDWIHRLSGPSMVGPAVSYYSTLSERGVRFRITGAYRVAVASDDQIEPDGSGINMFSIQPAIEFPIVGPLEVNAGVALHRFAGDFDDAFWHWSVPIYPQIRIPLGEDSRLSVRLGLGVHYFPKFDADDFVPLTVTVKRNRGEWSKAFFAGLDLKVR
ncbi:MAG: hypothetical protein MUO50_03930 [Longimicrobiales bacterium]|nr:hypothetical protein [Longimicrobiales bacterium]